MAGLLRHPTGRARSETEMERMGVNWTPPAGQWLVLRLDVRKSAKPYLPLQQPEASRSLHAEMRNGQVEPGSAEFACGKEMLIVHNGVKFQDINDDLRIRHRYPKPSAQKLILSPRKEQRHVFGARIGTDENIGIRSAPQEELDTADPAHREAGESAQEG